MELDLTAEKDFGDFITNGQIDSTKTSGGSSLISYLKQNLEKQYEGKYGEHFKAFYFAEDGYNPNDGSLTAGFSSLGADYVVVFKCKNEQTAAHEFLHSMNLPHTFTNKESTAEALFTYRYKKLTTYWIIHIIPTIIANDVPSFFCSGDKLMIQ